MASSIAAWRRSKVEREPKPAAKVAAEAISRAGKLGYDTANLVQDAH